MCGSASKQKILGKRLNASQGWNPKRKTGITTTIMRCSNCGLIYSNPLPIPNDLQDHYGITPENYWGSNHLAVTQDYFNVKMSRLKKIMQIKSGAKSLDIGAGVGHGMCFYEQAGFDAYGLEPSITFYQRAISKTGISKEKLKLASIETAEYPNGFFDHISFDAVYEHLYNPDEAIRKALTWLKPDGILHIEVPSSDWLISKFLNFYFKIIGTDYVTNISPMHSPFHLYEFGLKSFEENAKKNNYEILFSEYRPCNTFMPPIIEKILTAYMKSTNTGMQLSVWLKKKKG